MCPTGLEGKKSGWVEKVGGGCFKKKPHRLSGHHMVAEEVYVLGKQFYLGRKEKILEFKVGSAGEGYSNSTVDRRKIAYLRCGTFEGEDAGRPRENQLLWYKLKRKEKQKGQKGKEGRGCLGGCMEGRRGNGEKEQVRPCGEGKRTYETPRNTCHVSAKKEKRFRSAGM